MLRFLFQMVLNFQTHLFTRFLQTSGYLVVVKWKSQILIQAALKFQRAFFFCLRLYFDRTDSVILKIWRLRYMKCELASWVKRALLKTAAMATVGRLCHQGCPIRASLYIDSIVNSAHLALEGNYHPVRNLSVQFEPPIYITGKWNVVLSVLISELRRSKLRTVIWIL